MTFFLKFIQGTIFIFASEKSI